MANELSAKQRQAIEARGGNILVAAGAGSGKTTVLTERVLSLVCGEQPRDIDRLLVLTFTNAAAAQMRARIEDNLFARLLTMAGDAHLIRQLSLLQQAPITTVHAFCLNTLRSNFYHLDIDAGFIIPSEIERAILREETLAAFLENEYAKDDGLLVKLAGCYGGQRDDAALVRLIDGLYSFSRSQPYPVAWLNGATAAVAGGISLDGFAWSGFLQQELRQELILAQNSFKAASRQTDINIPPAWLTHVEREIAAIGAILNSGAGLAEFCRALSALDFAALPRAGKDGDEEAKEEFRRLRDQGKSAANILKEHFGRRDPQDMLTDLQALAPLMERLCTLVIDYGATLAEEKRRRNLLDFDDMEHFCLQLLEDESNGVAAALREQFDEILIDEYQDINAVQERLLTLLSRGHNIFAVGDVKQSIYRFRLAEPALFLQKYREYGQGKDGLRIDLNCNYRSTSAIILAINYIFRQLMSVSSSELAYDADAELKAGQQNNGAQTELWLVDRSATGEQDKLDLTAPQVPALVLEARLLGRRIKELQTEGYNLRDIAVLLRAAKNRESLLVQEFADMGIAAMAGSRPDYLQTPEIDLMRALLALIDNPLQELELATVLRSPLYGFSLDELARIRWAAPQEQLYNALTAAAGGEGALAHKCRQFIDQLTGWRQSLRRRRISELIGAIYAETALLQLVGALPHGAGRQENLLLLKERAREYEASSYRGLFRFLLFLADGFGKSAKEGSEPADSEDAVRVMSIHRSKGLEFPVVMVANLGGAFALQDEGHDIVWHKEYGLGPKTVEREQRRKFPSLAQQAVSRRLHKEALAEEMRVLYVALTRAREKLILSGVVKDLNRSAAAWLQQIMGQGPVLNGELLLRDKRPLDWLGQALLRHPHAGLLRRAAGLTPGSVQESRLLIHDNSEWQIAAVPEDELLTTALNRGDDRLADENAKQHPNCPDDRNKQVVEAALSYKYPYRAACETPAKRTVTELRSFNSAEKPQEPLSLGENYQPSPAEPPFIEAASADKRLTEGLSPALPSEAAARRGTVQHKLLQYLDFAAAVTALEVKRQLAGFVEQGRFTKEEAALVEAEKIACFANSKLGRRLAASRRALREISFTYALPAQELTPQAAPQDKLVLQGMIDMVFWEEEGWVLLDYKTGGAGLSELQLTELYAQQVRYYARAWQDIRQEPLKEVWLCFMDLQKNIGIEGW